MHEGGSSSGVIFLFHHYFHLIHGLADFINHQIVEPEFNWPSEFIASTIGINA